MTGSDDEREKAIKTTPNPEIPNAATDVEMHVVAVRRYDRNDVLVGVQPFVLFVDDEADSYIVSSVAEPAEPSNQKT